MDNIDYFHYLQNWLIISSLAGARAISSPI